VAHRAGHALHTAFAAKLLESRDAWELVELAAPLPAVAVPATASVKSAIAGR